MREDKFYDKTLLHTACHPWIIRLRQSTGRYHPSPVGCGRGTRRSVPDLKNETQIGLVFPVYAWGAPEPMLSFVKTLGKTDTFTFGVCTCGEEAGYTMKKLAKIFPLHSSYSLVMPNNYVIGSDVDDAQTVRRKIDAAYTEIQKLAQEVMQRTPVYRVTEGAHAALKSGMVNFGFNKFARSTKAFYATDTCNSCGYCAQNCPAATISLANGKPTWGKRCHQCLRCINACPQRAIQYGQSTETRGRYTIEQYVKTADAHATDDRT